MNTRFITALALLTLIAGAALADGGPVRRTVVVRDGKVISDETIPFDAELLGGKRAYLGVSLTDISPELREHFGATKETGVLVESVADDSPADKAGLRVGDVIVAVDGKDMRYSGDVRRALRDKKEGDSVRVDVVRGRARQSVVASVIEKEGPRLLVPGDIEALQNKIGRAFDGSEWRARVERGASDCSELQGRIKELETRLKELEKKLQK
ncbi:MAG TPA: PDZ domain-containing protein [Thermoanaerobaculia bacterium]|nr:PDZ domain-containing protein [Thermoanaerobaculia bacterium]